MATTYFGLICPQCHAGYPLGTESKRDWRYGIGELRYALKGRWELQCIGCGATSTFGDFRTWTPSHAYTAAQMAAAGTHVRRVPPPRTNRG